MQLRAATSADIDRCGEIVFDAFRRIAEKAGFPLYHPSVAAARGLIASRIDNPHIFGVVAEADGQIIGSNFLDERGPVLGIGPISVDPDCQGRGIGRLLMEAVLDRGAGAKSIRLLQDAHNPISLSLYASLGFDVKDITIQLAGRCRAAPAGEVEVRPLGSQDVEDCARLHQQVHGFDRTRELRDAIESPALAPFVAIRRGRVIAYATTFRPWQAVHAVARNDEDLQALISGSAALTDEMAFLLPVRQGDLFRWCLSAGFRAIRPMTYMVIGDYQEPRGTWIPSVLY